MLVVGRLVNVDYLLPNSLRRWCRASMCLELDIDALRSQWQISLVSLKQGNAWYHITYVPTCLRQHKTSNLPQKHTLLVNTRRDRLRRLLKSLQLFRQSERLFVPLVMTPRIPASQASARASIRSGPPQTTSQRYNQTHCP